MLELLDDLDVAALLRDVPESGLERGQTGTVVLTHGSGDAYEVEFMNRSAGSRSSIVATVLRDDLLKLKGDKRIPVAGSI
jgi:hypothetical protein